MSDYDPTPRLQNELKLYTVAAPKPMDLDSHRPLTHLRRATSPLRHITNLPTKELLFLNKDTIPNFNYASIDLPIASQCVLVLIDYTLFSSKIDLNYYLNSVDGSLSLTNSLSTASYTQKSLGRMFFGTVAEGSRHEGFEVGDTVCGVYYHLDRNPASGTLNTFLVVDPARDAIFIVPSHCMSDSRGLFGVDEEDGESEVGSSQSPVPVASIPLAKTFKLYRKLVINYSLWALHYCYTLQILARHAANLTPSTSVLIINAPNAVTEGGDLVKGTSLSEVLVTALRDLYSVSEICMLNLTSGENEDPAAVHTFRFNPLTDDKRALYNELQGYLGQNKVKFNYIINLTNPAALSSIIEHDKVSLLLAPRASGAGLVSVAYGYDSVTKPYHPVSSTSTGGTGDSSTWAGWFTNATTPAKSPLLYTIYAENLLDMKVINANFPGLSERLLPTKFTEFYTTHVVREVDRLKDVQFGPLTVRHYDWLDFREVFTKSLSSVRGKSGKRAVNVDDDDKRILFRVEDF